MNDTLKPCPFCGKGNSVVSLWFDDVAHRWRVGCGRCGCSTGTSPRDKTEAPAITAWNTRPDPLAGLSDAKIELLYNAMKSAEFHDNDIANAARAWAADNVKGE